MNGATRARVAGETLADERRAVCALWHRVFPES
jgi:hypothetical protein